MGVLAAGTTNANSKTYGFVYDERHQLVDVTVGQSALGAASFAKWTLDQGISAA